jgi:DNA-binding beta-propeller fold protein YncE
MLCRMYLPMLLFCSLLISHPQSPAGEIDTIAGTGLTHNNGNSGSADQLNISNPFGVEIGPRGALYITEVGNHRVLCLDRKTGTITTVAGNGTQGYSGDGGPATSAALNEPYEVRFDSEGNMIFVEMKNHLIRRVDAKTGIISTLAGTGKRGFSGDGGLATKATFKNPHSIALSSDAASGQGFVYVADIGNHRIRRINLATGIVDTIAGNGGKALPVPGQLIAGRSLVGPRALFLQGENLWIALREGHSVWRLDLKDGRIHHIAGTGKRGFHGDGASALKATFNGPKGIAVGPAGNVFVVDTENQVVRRINIHEKTIETIAGKGPLAKGYAGDGGHATDAKMNRPHGLCVDSKGVIYIGDTLTHRVRRVRP